MDRIRAAAPLPMPERLATNYDNYGSYWGTGPASETLAEITTAEATGQTVHEWDVADRAGHPMRIVRIADPTFLDTISVIPSSTIRTAVAA